MMPDLDGLASCACRQTVTRDIPVIFLTAKAQNANRCAYARLGAAGTLTKPFDPLTLSDQTTAILTGSERTPCPM